MTRFIYTAEKHDGEVYKRTAEANDRFELYALIRREGGHLLHMEEDHSDTWWSFEYWNSRIGSVSDQDKVLFARNISSMLGAGLPLSRALSVVERQAKAGKLKTVIGEVSELVRHGSAFHEALGQFPSVFSPLVVAMVRAGVEGGDLPNSLKLAADQTERMLLLKKKIKGAMLYPSIIVVAIIGIGTLLMTQVVPTLASTFEQMHAKLPTPTLIVIGTSNFLTQHFMLAFGGLVGIVVLTMLGLRTERGKRLRDKMLLHLPVIGDLNRELNAARTARTLASLLSAGVDVLTALSITHDIVQSADYKAVIQAAQEGVSQGEVLSRTFMRSVDLYPPFVGEMIAVGEETGQVSEMLKRVATYYEEEVDRKTKDMSAIIEPLLMLFIGIVVGFFAVSMIAPIYQITGNIAG